MLLGVFGLMTMNADTHGRWLAADLILFTVSLSTFYYFYLVDKKDKLPEFRRYLKFLGWQFVGAVDAYTFKPKHLNPRPIVPALVGISDTVDTESTVFMFPAHPNQWMVYEKFFSPDDSSRSNVTAWLLYLAIRLPSHVSGWIRILPKESFMLKLKKDFHLESIQFNDEVSVFVEPKKLGPLFLSPTFMEWYMQQPEKPWVHIEGDICCVSLGRNVTYNGLQELLRLGQEILPLIQKSGALDPVRSGDNTAHSTMAV